MTNNLVERIRNRIHDAPLETEYLLDECANVIEALSTTPGREEIAEAINVLTDHVQAWAQETNENGDLILHIEGKVNASLLADTILSLLRKEGV